LKEKMAIKHRTRIGEEEFRKPAKLKLQPSFEARQKWWSHHHNTSSSNEKGGNSKIEPTMNEFKPRNHKLDSKLLTSAQKLKGFK